MRQRNCTMKKVSPRQDGDRGAHKALPSGAKTLQFLRDAGKAAPRSPWLLRHPDLGRNRADIAFLLDVVHRLTNAQILKRSIGYAVAVEVELGAEIVKDETVIVTGLKQRDLSGQCRTAGARGIDAPDTLVTFKLPLGGLEGTAQDGVHVRI